MEHDHGAMTMLADDSFIGNLFKVYIPRYQCMYHETVLIWLHIVSDLIIAAAYYSIPVALVYFARRRRDLAFNSMFLLFAFFILLCGTTHIFNVLAIWHPVYRLEGVVKAATAMASLATAVLLWRLMPAALALPSVNEIRRRKDELETLVEARTSELQIANEALRGAKEKAESASTAKSEFLANMSHEIRTPINAIAGLTELLRRGNVPPEKQTLFLETMSSSVEHLISLINDLLDIARIEANSVQIEKNPFRLADVVDGVANLMRVQAAKKHLELVTRNSGSMDLDLIGDPLRLKQVLMNIVSNAVKFTERGSVAIETFCLPRPDRPQADVRIVVKDTGIGIPADKLHVVFDKFVQADMTITRRYGGTGLGLSISRTLVELMGGTIAVESIEGQGTAFTIQLTLPVKQGSRPDDGAPDRTPHAVPVPAKARILVVEDNPANVLLVTSMLSAYGYDYSVAENGEKALTMLQEGKFDLILMDVQMPVMDGLTATRLIRKKTGTFGRRVPIIAVTAHALKGDREKCLAAGMDGFLAKPFDPVDLKAILETHGASVL